MATTQLPQLERSGDDEEEESTTASEDLERVIANFDGDADEAKRLIAEARRLDAEDLITEDVHQAADTKPKKSKRTTESLRTLVREAEFRQRGGGAYEATIVREGPGNVSDKRYYTKQALKQGVASKMFEGLQAYANHPSASEERDRPERDVRQLVGHFREARFVDGQRAEVRAKFVPIEGPGYEWVRSLIESALQSPAGRPLIGISIDGYGVCPDEQQIDGHTYDMVREFAHLGSADIVTRAGAGGRFHRRLQESIRGAREAATDPPTIGPRKLQRRVQQGLAQFEDGLAVEDDEAVRAALTTLHEVAAAPLKVSKALDLAKVQGQLKQERERRRVAEARAVELDRVVVAAKVLREADLPPRTAELWHGEIAAQPDEVAMRSLLDRRLAERQEQLAEVRESLGLDRVEGNPPRPSSGPPSRTRCGRTVGAHGHRPRRTTGDTMTTQTATNLTPLSEHRNLIGFTATLRYPPGPSGEAAFYEDHVLLGRLSEAQRLATPAGMRGPTVRELGERTVNVIVAAIERERFGSWPVEPGGDILAKLDRHFRPRQEAHAAYRRKAEESADRAREASARIDEEVAERADSDYRRVWGLPTG